MIGVFVDWCGGVVGVWGWHEKKGLWVDILGILIL